MLKKTIFILLAWVIVVSAIEFGCSLVVRNRYIALDPVSPATEGSTLGYFGPDQDKILLFPGLKPYRVRTNALGLRTVGEFDDLSLKDLAGRKKILALGDSITFGLFVKDEDSYPHRLQKLLSSIEKDTVVLNAGVGSSTIADHLYFLRTKGLALNPDLVVINFCDNDLKELQEWQEPLYERLKEKSALSLFERFKLTAMMRIFREMDVRRKYIRSTKKIKDARIREILFRESKDIDDILYAVRAEYNPVVEDPRSPDIKEWWDRYFQQLDETTNLLRRRNIPYVIVIYPHIYTVFEKGKGSYQEVLTAHLKEWRIPYIDLTRDFQRRKSDILKLYNNLPRDLHLSGEGNEILAQRVLEFYDARRYFKGGSP